MTNVPAVFARRVEAQLRALGGHVTFVTGAGEKTFRAKFRVRDAILDGVGGTGAVGPAAILHLATPDAALLAEGDRFNLDGASWRLAGERMDDGRGMSAWDCNRIS